MKSVSRNVYVDVTDFDAHVQNGLNKPTAGKTVASSVDHVELLTDSFRQMMS